MIRTIKSCGIQQISLPLNHTHLPISTTTIQKLLICPLSKYRKKFRKGMTIIRWTKHLNFHWIKENFIIRNKNDWRLLGQLSREIVRRQVGRWRCHGKETFQALSDVHQPSYLLIQTSLEQQTYQLSILQYAVSGFLLWWWAMMGKV